MLQVPFNTAAFFDVFERYHRAVWPALFLLYASGLVAILGGMRGSTVRTRRSLLALAFLWAWMGIVYHWIFFTPINPAAYLFGAMFVVQAALLARAALVPVGWRLRFERGPRSWLGVSLLAYALLVYPILGYTLGHRFPRSPTFGLPCPTTILTIAILTIARPRAPLSLFAIPWIWALIGSQAAFQFGVWEDLGLLAAAVFSIAAWLGTGRGESRADGRGRRDAGTRRSVRGRLPRCVYDAFGPPAPAGGPLGAACRIASVRSGPTPLR
jgi:hypothetical protein